MPHFDANNAECFVFTFKEGLLSPIAHDLRLRVSRFSIDVDDANRTVLATFDANSLGVDVAMKDGAENPTALSPADKDKIAGQIRDEVLHTSRHPEITFRSHIVEPRADGGYRVQGELSLHGVTRAITADTRVVSGRQQLELGLHQPDFGIAPFRAMLGTLKIRADVIVRISL
jgi:polyisoprenoid-binding protein YceI